MKKRQFWHILILFSLCSFCLFNAISCDYVSWGGDLPEILDESLKSTITFYEENPKENSEALSYVKTYKIGTSYNRSALVLDSTSSTEFNKNHPGYNLAGWKYLCNAYDNSVTALPEGIIVDGEGYISSFTMPVDSFWVYGCWKPASDTVYKVHHWIQNLALDGYEAYKDQTLTGTTMELTAAAALEIEGFTPKAFEQAAISGDGSTEINIYYDRKIISIAVVCGEVRKTYSAAYGSLLSSVDSSFNLSDYLGSDNRFDRWIAAYEDGTTEELTAEDITFEKDNTVYTLVSKQKEAKTGTVTVTFPLVEDAVIDLNYDSSLVTYSGGKWTVPVTVLNVVLPDSSATVTSYAWYIYGNTEAIASTQTANLSFTSAGYYQIVVSVTDSKGNIYSSGIEIRITE